MLCYSDLQLLMFEIAQPESSSESLCCFACTPFSQTRRFKVALSFLLQAKLKHSSFHTQNSSKKLWHHNHPVFRKIGFHFVIQILRSIRIDIVLKHLKLISVFSPQSMPEKQGPCSPCFPDANLKLRIN